MKKLMAAATLSMITLTTATTAGAVEYPYLGLDYLQLELNPGSLPLELSPEAARLRFGAVMHKYVALEAHVIGGTADDSVVVNLNSVPYSFDASVDGIYSLNAALRLPLGDIGSLYAYGGYGVARLSLKSPVLDYSVDDDGLNYGATIELRLWKDWGLEVDYTTYLDNDVNELTAVGVGIRRRL